MIGEHRVTLYLVIIFVLLLVLLGLEQFSATRDTFQYYANKVITADQP